MKDITKPEVVEVRSFGLTPKKGCQFRACQILILDDRRDLLTKAGGG